MTKAQEGLTEEEESSPELDALCRKALASRRLEAFDNIDVAALLAPARLSVSSAQWIGRHLVRNGRTLAAYRKGREIVRMSKGLGKQRAARSAPA